MKQAVKVRQLRLQARRTRGAFCGQPVDKAQRVVCEGGNRAVVRSQVREA